MKKNITVLFAILLLTIAATAQTTITAMSYNIRLDVKSDGDNQWDNRKQKLATLLNFYEADFIGLQEVLHRQLVYLKDSLKKYTAIGVARDDGKEAGEYSNIFYKHDKYKLLQQSTFWLSPTPDTPSKGWDAALNRVCTYGLFKHKKTKQLVWVFNTHFDHIGKTARLESAKLIIKKINELNTKKLPVILMGDFNSKPDDEPAQYLMSQMQNCRNSSSLVHGNAESFNAFKFLEKPAICIDYIFVPAQNNISVTKFATLTDSYDLKYISDHFPVYAEIEINKQ